jgi:hypothetical protein
MVNNSFTINVSLKHHIQHHKNRCNKEMNRFDFDFETINDIKKWYHKNIDHFYRSSNITSFEIYHIKHNIFMIDFSFDTITLPFIEESLTNPDIFGKDPISINGEKYNIIGRKMDELEDLIKSE